MKPHLLQYLRWKERLQDGEPLDLAYLRGDLTYILVGLLTTKVKAGKQEDEELSGDFSVDLLFRINSRRVNEGKIMVSEEATRYFNQFVHRNMHELLLDRVLRGKANGIDEKDTIYSFITEIGLDDLVTFDALKKANYRLRNSRNIPDFYSHKRKSAA
jgi:hypothetical protein